LGHKGICHAYFIRLLTLMTWTSCKGTSSGNLPGEGLPYLKHQPHPCGQLHNTIQLSGGVISQGLVVVVSQMKGQEQSKGA
jgi:hypothetical protein